MATPGPMNPEAVVAQAKRLINIQLKTVLKSCNLPVSGAKATLQQRVINEVNLLHQRNDIDGFNRLRDRIYHPESSATYSPSPIVVRTFQNNSRPQQNTFGQSYSTGQVRPMTLASKDTGPRIPIFKESPFFRIIQALTPVLEMKVRESTRDSVSATINLQHEVAERLNQDPTIRVMIYCSADSMHSPFQKVDIAFPYQVEIRVNQDEVKANLRGLKNKPGSTRPADITDLLRKRAGYENHLQITYALTNKKFFVLANLVRRAPISELIATLKAGKIISKDRVIHEMKNRADDGDIMATSSILSLKCPLSTLRIEVPSRSAICSHNQCFDASSFLQLQEQAPTWTCPICNKHVAFEHLQIDQYVDDILKSTPRSIDQVTIEPDGNWSQAAGAKLTPRETNEKTQSSDDEDDLIEIQDLPQVTNIKREAVSENLLKTPPVISREQSSCSGVQPNQSSKKRSSDAIVDLTLSSDEDDEPVRPSKRNLTHRPSNTLPPLADLENLAPRTNGETQNGWPQNILPPMAMEYVSQPWDPL